MKKRILKISAAVILCFLALVLTGFLGIRYFFYDIPVLMYHYVDYTESDSSLFVSPESFKRQLDFIEKRGYRVLTLDEFIEYLKGKKRVNTRNLVLITFDDGRWDNYSNAYPPLKARGFSALFFVPSGLIGEQEVINSSQILEMAEAGMVFGSHSLTHAYLPSLEYQQLRTEVIESREALSELLNQEIKSIAYPIGGFNEDTLDLVREAGYEVAFTTNRGFYKDWRNDQPYAVRRVKVKDSDNNFNLWLKLSGIYNLFRSVKSPY